MLGRRSCFVEWLPGASCELFDPWDRWVDDYPAMMLYSVASFH